MKRANRGTIRHPSYFRKCRAAGPVVRPHFIGVGRFWSEDFCRNVRLPRQPGLRWTAGAKHDTDVVRVCQMCQALANQAPTLGVHDPYVASTILAFPRPQAHSTRTARRLHAPPYDVSSFLPRPPSARSVLRLQSHRRREYASSCPPNQPRIWARLWMWTRQCSAQLCL